MSRGSPSMVALLGLLAVAGFQNRDKFLGLAQSANPNSGMPPGSSHLGAQTAGSGGSMIDDLRGMLRGAGGGGLLGGLTDLIGRFTNPVQSAKARSWVDTSPNGALAPGNLEEALDDETLAELTEKTGLSRSELLTRLSTVLPDAIDQMTPEGRMPTPEEARTIY